MNNPFERLARKFRNQPNPQASPPSDEVRPHGVEQRERNSKANLARLIEISNKFEAAAAAPDATFAPKFGEVARFFTSLPQFTAVDWIEVHNQCDRISGHIKNLFSDIDKLKVLEDVGFEISQLEALRRKVDETNDRGYTLDPIYSPPDDKMKLNSQLVVLFEQQKVLTEITPTLSNDVDNLIATAPALDESFTTASGEAWLNGVGTFTTSKGNSINVSRTAAQEFGALRKSIGALIEKKDGALEYVSPAAKQEWQALDGGHEDVSQALDKFDAANDKLMDLVYVVLFLAKNEGLIELFKTRNSTLAIPTSLGKDRMVDAIGLVNTEIVPLIELFDAKFRDQPFDAQNAIESILGPTYNFAKAKASSYLVEVLLSDETYKVVYPLFAAGSGTYATAITDTLRGKSSGKISNLEKKLNNLLSIERRAYDSVNIPADAALVLPAALMDSVTSGLKEVLDVTAEPAKKKLTDAIASKREAEQAKSSKSEHVAKFAEHRGTLLAMMAEIMADPPMRFSAHQHDLIKAALEPIDQALASYKQLDAFAGNEHEFAKLEAEVIIFKYKYTKRAIHEQLAADEIKSGNHAFYFSSAYDQTIDDQGFKSLATLVRQLNLLATQPSLQPMLSGLTPKIEQDLAIFTKEYDLRRIIFFAERSMESRIFGEATSVTEGASRTFPLQAPEIFPTHDQFIEVIRGIRDQSGLGTDIFEELSFPGEKRYGRVIQTNGAVKLRDFSNEDGYQDKQSLITVRGEVMRLLDLLYSDRLYLTYKKALDDRGTPISQKEKSTLALLKGFFIEMHISTNKYAMPGLIQEVSKLLSPELNATELEIKQTWYFHTMLLNHAMLNPGVSPRCDDQIYKANQWFTYITSTEMQGVAVATIKEQLGYFGISDPRKVVRPDRPDDVPGKNYFFEREHITSDQLTPAKTFAEKLGFALTGESQRGGEELRDMLIKLFEEDHHERLTKATTPEEKKKVRNFGWLANLPLVVLRKNPISRFNEKEVNGVVVHSPTFRVLPMPLQLMIFKEAPPDPAEWQAKKDRKEIRKAEVYVKRWGFAGSQMDPTPVTAADFFDDKGLIRYEMIPWEDIVAGGELNQYYNNLKNLERFRAQIQEQPSDSILNREQLAKNNNDAKYAAVMIPEKGLEVLTGKYKADVVFWQWTVVRIFVRCLYLIASESKNLREIKLKLWQVADVVGSDTVEVMQQSLTKLFGNEETAERNRAAISTQLEKLLKFQS